MFIAATHDNTPSNSAAEHRHLGPINNRKAPIMTKTRYSTTYVGVAVLVVFIAVCEALFLGNAPQSLPIIGYSLIISSVVFMPLFRGEKNHSILIAIIVVMNLNLAVSVMIDAVHYAVPWQYTLFLNPSNVITAKALYVFAVSLLFGMYLGLEHGKQTSSPAFQSIKTDSILLRMVLAVLLVYILFKGRSFSGGGAYQSNTNAAFEYAVVFLVIGWYVSSKGSYYRKFLIVYAVVYCVLSLFSGDRSAAFPMVLACFLFMLPKGISLTKALIICLAALLFANVIAVVRTAPELTFGVIVEGLRRGFYSDTLSFSYYAGTTIVLYGNYVSSFSHLLSFLGGIIFGGGYFQFDLATLAKGFSSELYNGGGGLTSTYWYFWFSYFGCVFGGILMGIIAGATGARRNNSMTILYICIVAEVFRWYGYFPIAFFRTALFVPLVFILFLWLRGKIHGRYEQTN